MEDEQNGSYQHGRQPNLSKSIKQVLECGKKNCENWSVVSSLARFFTVLIWKYIIMNELRNFYILILLQLTLLALPNVFLVRML